MGYHFDPTSAGVCVRCRYVLDVDGNSTGVRAENTIKVTTSLDQVLRDTLGAAMILDKRDDDAAV